jgi:hypothetical protein
MLSEKCDEGDEPPSRCACEPGAMSSECSSDAVGSFLSRESSCGERPCYDFGVSSCYGFCLLRVELCEISRRWRSLMV